MSSGRSQSGCAIMPTRKPRASRKRPISAPAERGVIDVGVAVDDQDVELVPAARVHLRARGGEEGVEDKL
jgi:hypothetical protein